jgi:hypothetical protein
VDEFIIKPIALFVVLVLKPLAELSVTPDPTKLTIPEPICIIWQENPIGKILGDVLETVTVIAEDELIKIILLLSADDKVKLEDLVSKIKPFAT